MPRYRARVTVAQSTIVTTEYELEYHVDDRDPRNATEVLEELLDDGPDYVEDNGRQLRSWEEDDDAEIEFRQVTLLGADELDALDALSVRGVPADFGLAQEALLTLPPLPPRPSWPNYGAL